MTTRPGKRPRGEEGATLILALVFVLLTSVIMLAIVTLSGTDILNTTNLQNERALEYSAEGAVQSAVQAVRYLDPSPMTFRPQLDGVLLQFLALVLLRTQRNDVSDTHNRRLPGRDPDLPAHGHLRSVPASGLRIELREQRRQHADLLKATVLISDVSASCADPGSLGCYNPVGAESGSTSGTSVTVESWIVERANG